MPQGQFRTRLSPDEIGVGMLESCISFRESVFVLCFVVRYFMSILVLQSY